MTALSTTMVRKCNIRKNKHKGEMPKTALLPGCFLKVVLSLKVIKTTYLPEK